MSGLVDTIMNLLVFAFVGVLIWLYFKKEPFNGTNRDDDTGDRS